MCGFWSQAPFTYEALPPEKINFIPLKQKQSFNGKELLQVWFSDIFLHAASKSMPVCGLSTMQLHNCLLSYLQGTITSRSHRWQHVVLTKLDCRNWHLHTQALQHCSSQSVIRFSILQLISRHQVLCAMQYYLENDAKLKKFVPIIQDSAVDPVILDANRTICSMPPIVNGAHSAVRWSEPCTQCAWHACTHEPAQWNCQHSVHSSSWAYSTCLCR